MLNMIIDNALRGVLDITINTNYIIQGMHKISKDYSKYFAKVGKAWSPYTFFQSLQMLVDVQGLYFKKHTIEKVSQDSLSNFKKDFINKYVLSRKGPIPDVLIVDFMMIKMYLTRMIKVKF